MISTMISTNYPCPAAGRSPRRGAILPMFAFLLPVLLIFCGLAINLAYMQCTTTELKIATDATAHAAGRAMSIYQTTDDAIRVAETAAQLNTVNGEVIEVSAEHPDEDGLSIGFGVSTRGNNGYGSYHFVPVPKDQIDSGAARATSVAVTGKLELPLVFQVMNFSYFGGDRTEFTATRRSIATQVDRDIALVLDRSGSMLYYQNEGEMTELLNTLYNTWDTESEPGYWLYGYWKKHGHYWHWKGYHRQEDAKPGWVNLYSWAKYYVNGTSSSKRRISQTELQNATKNLYQREYSDNVIYQVERWFNEDHTLGDSFTSNEAPQLTSEMARYMYDWEYVNNRAPRYSRWYYLDLGVKAFLNVIEATDQEERVSLITFNSSSRVDHPLMANYDDIRSTIESLSPYGGTAIGEGLLDAVYPIIHGPIARPFAAKTIVVLTDGQSNTGIDPVNAAHQIIQNNNITIHTVTFSVGADKARMETVAETGYGKHYHTDDGDQLIDIFEEIANNLPTILTE